MTYLLEQKRDFVQSLSSCYVKRHTIKAAMLENLARTLIDAYAILQKQEASHFSLRDTARHGLLVESDMLDRYYCCQ